MTRPFDLGIFQEILDTYGADIQRWPVDARESAEDFLKNSDDAQALYTQALKIDQALCSGKESEPPPDLLDKILKNTDR